MVQINNQDYWSSHKFLWTKICIFIAIYNQMYEQN